jgi:spore coat protein U-like protein
MQFAFDPSQDHSIYPERTTMLFKKTLLATALLAFGGFSVAAMAATTSDTFDVKLTITAACSVTAGLGSDIDFGSQSSTATNLAQTNNISVTCSKTTPYDIGLLPSAANSGTANGTGNMASVSTTDDVPYALWQDSSHTTVWGNTVSTNTLQNTGTGSAQSIPVFATVASANFAPGTYLDTVTVTVTY